jgi:uncharacterized LabA/DUF88 family protein
MDTQIAAEAASFASPRNRLRTAVFIDGAHLSKTLRNAYGSAPVAYDKLATIVAGDSELMRTYYYDALPYLPEQPTEEELHRYGQRERFFRALRSLSRFVVREGRVARCWDPERRAYVYRQKRVDLSLCADLVRLASKGRIDVAVLVTGDSDFVPAVEMAKEEGVQVRLLHSPDPRETHRDLLAAVDERIVLDAEMIAAAHFVTQKPASGTPVPGGSHV